MGVEDEYAAYCLDQAVGYLGTHIENELERAGHKPSREENRTRMARERIIKKHFGETKPAPKKFADPAAFFS